MTFYKTVEPEDKLTYVALVIDRSGSMGSVMKEALAGINEQISSIKTNASKGGTTYVSLIEFDDVIDVVFANKLAADLQEVTEYYPRNTTAMYDAVGRAITLLESCTETKDTGYLVVVISDGMENASKEWNSVKLADKVKRLQATGKWTFAYMLSNVDLSLATNLGVPLNNVRSYISTNIGTQEAMLSNSISTVNYLSSRASGLTMSTDFHKPEEDKK